MIYRLMILLIALQVVASCSLQQTSNKTDLTQLDLRVLHVSQKTPLMIASESGNSSRVKLALEQGALLNNLSSHGSAFSLALMNRHRSITRILFAAGADWHIGFEKDHSSALIHASDQAYDNLVKTLILRDADLDIIDSSGHSALSRAAFKGHLTTVKILVNAGANVDVAPEGRSLLMHVVEQENMLISQLIIAGGADVNFRDQSGDSALKIARRLGYYDLDLMLVQSGAQL